MVQVLIITIVNEFYIIKEKLVNLAQITPPRLLKNTETSNLDSCMYFPKKVVR